MTSQTAAPLTLTATLTQFTLDGVEANELCTPALLYQQPLPSISTSCLVFTPPSPLRFSASSFILWYLDLHLIYSTFASSVTVLTWEHPSLHFRWHLDIPCRDSCYTLPIFFELSSHQPTLCTDPGQNSETQPPWTFSVTQISWKLQILRKTNISTFSGPR